MSALATTAPLSLLEPVLDEFVAGIVETLPRVLAGIAFLSLAYVGIKLLTMATRTVFDRLYPPNQTLIVDLVVTVVGVFLWFGTGLALLKIVGLGDIAASLGTAAGFIGLGIAFALKEMIADTVAGVYLLQDPDFNESDEVTTASVTGTITSIGLRKTRIRTDEDDLVILANRDVEEKWTKEASESGLSGDSGSGAESG
ncbi:MAG: mechanosensitive ion channel domain-containing protein [Halanaeroarchaeum sp.]